MLENRALLERCGFEAEDFGGGDVLIRQIPSDVDVEDAKALLQELAGKLLAGKTLDPNGLRDELLHSIACKSAIKAGWQTSDEELRRLVQEVLTRDDIKYCPHGRPVCVTLTKRQLEKAVQEGMSMDRIICVVGPTASGKTKLAVQLAKAYDGEVVSCDSMQIYKHMDIGTAKPTPEEMEGVPHHMIDCVEPGEDFSVGKYVQLADGCVQDILSRGKTAVIAGGTGLYVDSLIAGRTFAPVPQTGKREALEAQLRQEGGEAMLRKLRAVDPDAAALHPADEKTHHPRAGGLCRDRPDHHPA